MTSDNTSGQITRTPLYASHVEAGAKLVDFTGWEMPVNYGSQIEEHQAVRQSAGMFDVSHMTIVDITGRASADFLSRLLANDIAKATPVDNAVYSSMLNEAGGIIDDLIAYSLDNGNYRLVVNAGTREKDLAWILQNKPVDTTIAERSELAMIAVQGPQAMQAVSKVATQSLDSAAAESIAALSRFSAVEIGQWFIARTGYTGEDGVEISLPADAASELWAQLLIAGVRPCGLGARDTLRLEAGMNLYGSDMDEAVTPLESGLSWTVAWQPAGRNFIGRSALEAQKAAGVPRLMRGLVLQGRGVLRGGQTVYVNAREAGRVCSGTFSPTLQKSIAFARLNADVSGSVCEVQVRDKRIPASIVKIPFVKQGKANITSA